MTFDEVCECVSAAWSDEDLLTLVIRGFIGNQLGDPDAAPDGAIGVCIGGCLRGAFALLGVKDQGPAPKGDA